jgi:hypothetical protein
VVVPAGNVVADWGTETFHADTLAMIINLVAMDDPRTVILAVPLVCRSVRRFQMFIVLCLYFLVSLFIFWDHFCQHSLVSISPPANAA